MTGAWIADKSIETVFEEAYQYAPITMARQAMAAMIMKRRLVMAVKSEKIKVKSSRACRPLDAGNDLRHAVVADDADLDLLAHDPGGGFHEHEIFVAVVEHQPARHGDHAARLGEDDMGVARHAVFHLRLGAREVDRDEIRRRAVHFGLRAVNRRHRRRESRAGAERVERDVRRIACFDLRDVALGNVRLDFQDRCC